MTPLTLATPEIAAAFLLAFARIGTLVMLMPGLGERSISGRARLAFALLLTLVLFPIARPLLPVGSPTGVVGLLVGEIAVGLVIGLSVRMVMAALQTAGTVVAQQLGLAYAMTVDPSMGGQQASIGNFLTLTGIALIFAMDLHHIALMGIRDSYALMPPTGLPPPTADAAALALKAMGQGFALSVQIAAPFIAFGILFNLGLGVLSRLMPQLQVFFLAMPAAILVGMIVLLGTLGVMMSVFVEELAGFLREMRGG